MPSFSFEANHRGINVAVWNTEQFAQIGANGVAARPHLGTEGTNIFVLHSSSAALKRRAVA